MRRIDDKLSRIARGHTVGEDTILDLVGYLVLLLIRKTPACDSTFPEVIPSNPIPTGIPDDGVPK